MSCEGVGVIVDFFSCAALRAVREGAKLLKIRYDRGGILWGVVQSRFDEARLGRKRRVPPLPTFGRTCVAERRAGCFFDKIKV